MLMKWYPGLRRRRMLQLLLLLQQGPSHPRKWIVSATRIAVVRFLAISGRKPWKRAMVCSEPATTTLLAKAKRILLANPAKLRGRLSKVPALEEGKAQNLSLGR